MIMPYKKGSVINVVVRRDGDDRNIYFFPVGSSYMKFFHLSDLHIGLKLLNRDLREDQEFIFGQIVELATQEQPDAVVIAGDIYDKPVPSAEAVQIFDNFVSTLASKLPAVKIMMISGNHDSGARLNVFRQILKRQGVYMIGTPPVTSEEHIEKITLRDGYGIVNFYLLPFVKPSMVRDVVAKKDDEETISYDEALRRLLARENIDTTERNVLVSHQFYLPAGKKADDIERMESEICTVGNVDEVRADVLAPFDYAALGHIHKPMAVGKEVFRYSGTPLACSVSEAGQLKGVIMAEMLAKGEIKTKVLPLAPLRQVKIIRGAANEVLAQACGDYVTVILTDEGELGMPDLPDRLREAFPYLLEIRRENRRRIGDDPVTNTSSSTEPLELIKEFLPDLSDEETAILQDVINSVKEGVN